MALEVTVLNGGGTAAGTADVTDRLRADLGLQLGNRAHMGEAAQSTFYIDDDDGEYGNEEGLPGGLTMLSIAAHNVVTFKETATTPDTVLVRGRVISQEIGRAELHQDRGRQLVIRADDYNADLKGITLLTSQARSAETDVARVTWVFDTFLSGSPRLTTNLTSGIVGANTVTLPAKTYDAGTPILDILNDCAITAEKTFFVMADGTFYYASYDDTSQRAGLRISDRDDEIDFGVGSAGVASVVDSLITHVNSGGAGFNDKTNIPVNDGNCLVAFASSNTTTAWTSITYWPGNVPGTGVSYNLTKAASALTAGERVEMWVLLNPPTATHINGGALRYQYADALDKMAYGWVVLDGVSGYSSFTNTGTGTAVSTATGASAGDLVVDLVGWWQNVGTPVASTKGANQTLLEQDTLDAAPGQSDGEGALSTADGEATVSWTLNTSVTWGHVGLVFDGSVATFPPIWTGPASTEDGQGLLSGGVLRYGGSAFVTETRASVVEDYDYHVEPIHDEGATDATDAANRLSAILDVLQYEKRTYQVAVQLHRSQVDLVQAGQMISIKARAIPDADDQYRTRRIASLEWQWIGPEHWLAVMELDRPLNMRGAGAASGGQKALATRPANAAQMPITDSGGYFDGDSVEEALQELGAAGVSEAVIALAGASVTVTNDSSHNGFPDIARMANGNLIAVYRKGTNHDGSTPDGRIVRKISTDEGATWGSEAEVFNDATNDVRGAGVAVLRDGTVIVNYSEWDGTAGAGRVMYTIRSTDNGSTWDTPVALSSALTNLEYSSGRVVELANGDLVQPFYGDNSPVTARQARLLRSTDGGDTWGSEVTIASAAGEFYTEPEIIRLTDGRYLCAIRHAADVNGTSETIDFSYSDDECATWSAPVVGFLGYGAPGIVEARSGAVVCLYRKTGTSPDGRAVFRVSWDRGATWADEQNLEATGNTMDYGNLLAASESRIVAIYADKTSNTNADIILVDLDDVTDQRYSNSSRLTVSEEDGSPIAHGVTELRFTNATVTHNADGSVSVAGVTASMIENVGYWSPLTNGNLTTPELVFADGDTIAVWTET